MTPDIKEFFNELKNSVIAQDPEASILIQSNGTQLSCTIDVNKAFSAMAAESLLIVAENGDINISLEENRTPASEISTIKATDFDTDTAFLAKVTNTIGTLTGYHHS